MTYFINNYKLKYLCYINLYTTMDGFIYLNSRVRNDCFNVIESLRLTGFTCNIKESEIINCDNNGCWRESFCTVSFFDKNLSQISAAVKNVKKNKNIYRETINVTGVQEDFGI